MLSFGGSLKLWLKLPKHRHHLTQLHLERSHFHKTSFLFQGDAGIQPWRDPQELLQASTHFWQKEYLSSCKQNKLPPQFHHGTCMLTSLLMFTIKTISCVDIPLSTTVICSEVLYMNYHRAIWEPSPSVSMYRFLGKVSKSTIKCQMRSFHWRTAMKCTIKVLKQWEEVTEGCRPHTSPFLGRDSSVCQKQQTRCSGHGYFWDTIPSWPYPTAL